MRFEILIFVFSIFSNLGRTAVFGFERNARGERGVGTARWAGDASSDGGDRGRNRAVGIGGRRVAVEVWMLILISESIVGFARLNSRRSRG